MRLLKFKIDEKRIRLPFRAIAPCPSCEREVTFSGEFDYPTIGVPEKVYALCSNDDCEMSVDGLVETVVIEVSVSPAPGSKIVRLEHGR